jgi:hypothetical protein
MDRSENKNQFYRGILHTTLKVLYTFPEDIPENESKIPESVKHIPEGTMIK